MPDRRPNLSAEVADTLRDRIIDGALLPGDRLNEVHLSGELQVSRTPVREALSRLASEGFVTARPRRGFFVTDLDDEEIEQLYKIRAILDPAALELGGLPPSRTLDELDEINFRILGTRGSPARTVDVDDEWHIKLLSHCPNQILLDLIRQFMSRTRPYEHAYMRETSNVEVVVREHRKIQRFLADGDLEGACAALFRNMQSAVEPLLEWRQKQRETSRAEAQGGGDEGE